MLGLGLAIPAIALRRRGGGVGAAAGTLATTFPTAPSVHFHPHSATATFAGGRVTGATDRAGLANASEGAAGLGPLRLTDGLGRDFWRFQGSEYLNVATGLVADQRAITVFAVVRNHRLIASPFFGQGNAAAGTAVNTGRPTINAFVSGGIAPYLNGHSIAASADAANKAKLVIGQQVQVIGVVSRTTANGGQRLYLNGEIANVGQATIGLTGVQGGEIGRFAYTPGASGTWGSFDLYELAIFAGTLTNAQADAIAAAMVANWSIPAITNQLVLEGDSITQGVGDIPNGQCLGMQLAEPGGAWSVPDGWRVVSMGTSGNQTSHLVTRRDVTNTVFDCLLPGRNVVTGLIGRNDLGAGGKTGQQTYDAIVPLINTTTTGYLQRGWEVRWGVNIAVSSGAVTENGNLRTLLRAAQFLTDTLTASGQTYAGKLALIDLPLLTVAGSGTIFDTVADSTDPLWFQGDSTHPTVAGTIEIAKAYRAAL